MSGKRRRSFETGHRPKFLVVLDGTPESGRAIYFAARRAARLGASMAMLAVIEPPDAFEWLGVGDAMREEAEEEAQELLETAGAQARQADEILKLIEEDEDISFLVLAAAAGKSGPGPLLTSLLGTAAASFPIPVVIVPAGLSDEEIDALAG
jgi:nucleotide-binding universal stress UspA family protein